ncbi:MAG: PIN domain-containing protein [Spirochaetales bacterium]|nr:PIN domain-containing protein [Spirochaetales bacterium]
MTYGLDTTFTVQLGVAEHPTHAAAVGLRDRLLADSHDFALAPQVLAEHVHIVTDPRRFTSPATAADALDQSRAWWEAIEIRRVYVDDEAVAIFYRWMAQHSLGRRRILDTMLAATYHSAGITAIISSNGRDYRPFFKTIVSP